jgi:ABC-type glycerol-3-phosphate transport system substrate-binding protein
MEFKSLLRHFMTVSLIAIGFVLFAGCRARKPDLTEDGRIIVEYWEKWNGFEGDAMQAVVNDFNTSQKRIFVKYLPVSTIDQKLMLATAGGNPPDIAGLWTHSIPSFAEKGALTPLDKLVRESGLRQDDYIPVFWDLCHYRGFMWALPSTPATLGLHWNKKLFREAGLDPDSPPRDIAELERMNEKLTIVDILRDGELMRIPYGELTDAEKETKDFDLVQAGHFPNIPGWWNQMWGFWFGGSLWDSNRTITANSSRNVEAYNWVKSYPDRFGIENMRTFGASFGNNASPQDPFLSGQVAMVLQGCWMQNFVDKFAPELEWGAAPFPSIDRTNLAVVTIAESDILVIPKGARHPREAFEFMRYVNTQPVMEKLSMGQRKFTPLHKVSDEFLNTHPNPYISVFIEMAKSPNARFVPKLPIWTEYRDELDVACSQIYSLIAPPEEALTEVTERVQWKFDRINRRWDKIKDVRTNEWSAFEITD